MEYRHLVQGENTPALPGERKETCGKSVVFATVDKTQRQRAREKKPLCNPRLYYVRDQDPSFAINSELLSYFYLTKKLKCQGSS